MTVEPFATERLRVVGELSHRDPDAVAVVERDDTVAVLSLVEGSIVLPRWSPDSSQIGYTDIERNGLFVVDVETGETRRILDSDERATWVDENTMIVDLSD